MRRIPSIRVRLALGASALAALALPAAASAGPSCQASGANMACTFGYTGAAQTWTVPADVTEATFEVSGAAGDSTLRGSAGGLGGRATATIAVTPGETLQVNVGGSGHHHIFGGFNGGANGGSGWEDHGGGGGGASDVRAGAFTLTDRIIVGGGGGGGGGPDSPGGSGGGTAGASGTFKSAGGGGTQTAGGAGGPASMTGGPGSGGRQGGDGVLGSGGLGAQCGYDISNGDFLCDYGGGGGGGGYYGGGGGGGGDWGYGGGGGSGFGPDGVVFQSGVRAGNGLVRISYTDPHADTSPPTTAIALDPSGPDGENGWYVSSVRATVSAVDEQSGTGVSETRCTLDPASIPASFGDLPAGCPFTGVGSEIDSDGQHALYAASRDSAGNAETLVSRALKIDRTAPAVTCDHPATSFRLNEAGGSVAATVSDTTSGPTANTVSAAVDTTSVGARTATVTGEDAAGNKTATACPYAVTYAFGGFFTPVDNLDANGDPILNVVKAGRTIPLKWRLTDATGAPVTNLTSAEISVLGIPCTADAALDQLEELAATGSGLQNLGDGNYQLNWKSPISYANSCKRLRLDLAEGSTTTPTYHTADFKFTQ